MKIHINARDNYYDAEVDEDLLHVKQYKSAIALNEKLASALIPILQRFVEMVVIEEEVK